METELQPFLPTSITLVLGRVKWSAQPINPYSLGFRNGVGTIDAIATLIHTAAPITALRRGYKSRSSTIFLDIENAFELVSKEVLLESVALLGIRGQMLMWLDDYLTNLTGTVHSQGKKSKVNQLTNGTPQGSSLSPTLFNIVINQLLQLNLGNKVQMIAYADDLTIHGGPRLEFQYRWRRESMASTSQIPRGHRRQNTKLQETSRLHKTNNWEKDEFTQSTELTIGRQRKYFEDYLHINYSINIGVRNIYLWNYGS